MEVDRETGKRKPTEEKGTGAVSPAPGLDACLLYEDDSDQDAYLFPLPMIDESNDSPGRSDGFVAPGASSTRELRGQCAQQRSDQMFQSSHQKRSHCIKRAVRELLISLPGSSAWVLALRKIEGRFNVRNVTKPIVAAGQVTDRGQGVWLNGDGRFILDVKSARKIEKLLGDKRGFVELRKQKGVYVIPCEEQSSNLFPLVEQEPSQGRQMDRGEVEVEEERQEKVKSAPVLPTDKERDEHEVTHATFRSWCEACVAGRATEGSHKRSATEPSVPLVAMDYRFFGRDTDVNLATILVLLQRPSTVRWELVRCFAKAQSLTRSTVCWHTFTPGA